MSGFIMLACIVTIFGGLTEGWSALGELIGDVICWFIPETPEKPPRDLLLNIAGAVMLFGPAAIPGLVAVSLIR